MRSGLQTRDRVAGDADSRMGMDRKGDEAIHKFLNSKSVIIFAAGMLAIVGSNR